MYQRWRDEAILTLPVAARSMLGALVEESRARALKEGWATEQAGQIVTEPRTGWYQPST